MSSKKIVLKDVRVSFPNLFQPRKDQANPRFDSLFVFDKGSEADMIVQAAVAEVVKEKWSGKIPVGALAKCGHHDGVKKSQYEGFDESNMYVSASNKTRPSLKDRDGRTPLDEAGGKIYPGVFVVAYLTVSAIDTDGYGKQCNFYIDGVQFYRDGEPLGAGKPMDDGEFMAFEDEGDSAEAGQGMFG